MQHAVRARDGAIVHANEVAPGTTERFCCDWCRADAEHKAGRVKIAHFAHWRGQADPTLCPFVIIGRCLRHSYSYNDFSKEDPNDIPVGFYYYFGLKPPVSSDALRHAYRRRIAGTADRERDEINAVYLALTERLQSLETDEIADERGDPAAVSLEPSGYGRPLATEPGWQFAIGGKVYGPYSEGVVEQMLRSGQITPQSLAWFPGKGTLWAPLSSFQEFLAFRVAPADPHTGLHEFSLARQRVASLSPIRLPVLAPTTPVLSAPREVEGRRTAAIAAGMALIAGVALLLGYAMWPSDTADSPSRASTGPATEAATLTLPRSSPRGSETAPPEVAPTNRVAQPATTQPAESAQTDTDTGTASAGMVATPAPIAGAPASFRVVVTLPLKRAYVMVRLEDREVWRHVFKGTSDGTRISVKSEVVAATSGNISLKVWVIAPDKIAADEYAVFPISLEPGENPPVEIGFDSSRPVKQRLVPPSPREVPSVPQSGGGPISDGWPKSVPVSDLIDVL